MNAAMQKNAWPKVQYSQTQLGGISVQGNFMPGGLDLITPSLRLQPGVLRDVMNYECAQQGGYSRIEGNERYDGRASPSAATFQIIQVGGGDFTADFTFDFTQGGFNHVPAVGDVVTQHNTNATGTIIAVVEIPVPYIVVTMVTGAFNTVDYLTVPPGIIIGNAAPFTASITARQLAIYLAAAADVYRALIQRVPGSGPVTGVLAMIFNGQDRVYAFRANTGNTAVDVWTASPTGWIQVSLGRLVSFTGGTGTANPPLDGAILTQGAVTATVSRVMWQSGAWAVSAGTAVGQLVIGTPAGGSFAAGTATLTGGATVTLTGPSTAITLLPGGRFEFAKGNFSGQADTRRAYGCDGVNPCFEFDGTVLAPIKTGLVPDAPSHIAYHRSYLFISRQASILHCGANLPFRWTVPDGAGEIATGDTVNGMLTLPGDQTSATMAVVLKSGMAVLYGTDPTTWNYVAFSTLGGGMPYSIQNMFDTFVLDDFGVVNLKTTLNFGNFAPTSLTKAILPLIQSQRGNMTATSVNREKGQYRMYFRDGTALYLSMTNQNYLGTTRIQYPHPVFCTDTAHRTTDDEATYAGGFDGYVYHLDIGTSFDGGAIDAYFVTAWDPLRAPRVLKRWRAASIELQGENYTEFRFGYQLGYNNDQIAQIPGIEAIANISRTARWDQFVWDDFIWDGSTLQPTDLDMTGTAENIRFTISSGTNYIPAFSVNSIIQHYSLRRGMRV